MFFTADQLVLHAIGDYLLQSDWMATSKTKSTLAALCHVATYGLPFILLPLVPGLHIAAPSLAGYCFIVITHFIIDRWRLARYVVWLKNWLGPNRPWAQCQATGYPPDTPPFLSVWLLIIADNLMHLVCNAFAFRFL